MTKQINELNKDMTIHFFTKTLKVFIFITSMTVLISCNSNNKPQSSESSGTTIGKEAIPDTVVQFLITSASNDFRKHQPPTPIDIRNVKIGYLKSSNSDKTFVLCGEFLSKENNDWENFTTIKTSGYEQYLGKTQYCQDATMVLSDKDLSLELKSKLTE